MMEGLQHLSAKNRAYLMILLFTGARRSEARLMRWADVDERTRLWKKPHTKNGFSHMVPLPVQVMEALRRLPRKSEWIFPGQQGKPWSEGTSKRPGG
jgi:integrase